MSVFRHLSISEMIDRHQRGLFSIVTNNSCGAIDANVYSGRNPTTTWILGTGGMTCNQTRLNSRFPCSRLPESALPNRCNCWCALAISKVLPCLTPDLPIIFSTKSPRLCVCPQAAHPTSQWPMGQGGQRQQAPVWRHLPKYANDNRSIQLRH